MTKINNVAPTNLKILNNAPDNNRALNPFPNNSIIQNQNFTYLDQFTIQQGQPMPFGLNWLMTYPHTFSFQGVRK